MKGHGCWTYAYPYLSLFILGISLSMGLLTKRGRGIEGYKIFVPNISRMKKLSPI
jgi:hypothetical protein